MISKRNFLFLSFCHILGPQMSKRVCCFSIARFGGDIYTFGGLPSGRTGETAIHRLTCSSRVCKWTTINQQLKVAKWNTVAIPVMDSLCIPTTPTTTATTPITSITTTTTTNLISSKKINTNMTVFECLEARSRRIFTD